jgi:hypothetical protein
MFNNRQIHSQLQNPQIQNSNRLRYVRLVTTSMTNNGTSKSANNGESRLGHTSTSPCGIIQNQIFVPPRMHSLVSSLNSSNQNISNTLHVGEAVVSFLILIIN